MIAHLSHLLRARQLFLGVMSCHRIPAPLMRRCFMSLYIGVMRDTV
jgi:hypothetical protein